MSKFDRGAGVCIVSLENSHQNSERKVELDRPYISELQAKILVALERTIFECILKSLDFKL